jgi:hypothetical protein
MLKLRMVFNPEIVLLGNCVTWETAQEHGFE